MTRETEILRHALGLDRGKDSYRNRYVTAPDCAEWDLVKGMEARGLLRIGMGPTPGFNPYTTFVVTDAGRAVAEAKR